jgi:hypothetical protein
VPSYLDDTFLGGAEDSNYEVGAADNLPAVYQSPAPPAVADTVRLPGGIVIPKQTAIILAAIIVAIALWWWKNKQKKG